MTERSLKAVLKQWGTKYHNTVHFYIRQLNFRDTLKPMHEKELDNTHSKSVLESHMFLKKKRDDNINRQTLDGVYKHGDYISKEDPISSTVAR